MAEFQLQRSSSPPKTIDLTQSQNEALEALDEQLTCSVCLDIYEDPKTLPCLHSFCLKCIKRLPKCDKRDGFTLDCPVCRKSHDMPANGIDTLPHAFHIKQLFQLQRKMSSATPTPITPDMPFPMVGGMVHQPHQEGYCPEHNDLLRVFCTTCNKLICRDCTVTLKHRNHDYNLVNDLYPLAEKAISDKIQATRKKVQMVQPMVGIVKEREDKIRDQGDEMKQKITDHTELLISKIKDNEAILHKAVDDAVGNKCKWLGLQQQDISETLHAMNRVSDLVETEVNRGSKVGLLAHKMEIESNFVTVNERFGKLALIPIEDNNLKFTESEISAVNMVGVVDTTYFYNECSVSLSLSNDTTVPWVAGMTRTLLLCIESNIAVIPLCLLSIVVESQHKIIESSIVSVNQSDYAIQFTPQTPGRHNIKVLVCEKEVMNSPIVLMVSYSPSLKDREKLIIPRLNKPHGCTVINGTIIVAEYGGHCVTLLDQQGKKVRSIGGGKLLVHPRGVALSADQNSFLVTDDHRIQQFTFDGELLCSAGNTKHGPSRDEFYNPTGIAVNPSTGNIYVADTDNNRIQVLNDRLQVISSFGRSSIVTERLKSPYAVALDNAGDIYVADSWNHCIKKYSSKGRLLCQISSEGMEPGKLSWPTSLAFNSFEYLYITEQDNQRVSVYSREGQIVSCFDGFNGPQDIYVDQNGNVYVSDTYDNKLHIYYT